MVGRTVAPELSRESKCGGDGQDDDGQHVRRRTNARALDEEAADVDGRETRRRSTTRREEGTKETHADPGSRRCVERNAARTHGSNKQQGVKYETDVWAKEKEADERRNENR